MTNARCDRCGKEFNTADKNLGLYLKQLPSGRYRCLDCFLTGITSFRSFLDHFIKYKIETAEGKRHNMIIMQEVEKDIVETRNKILMRDRQKRL